MEALRCLKRRLTRIFYNTLTSDHQTATPTCIPQGA